ncbi:calcium-binding protein [Novosphingobium percolationis]|uniref:calcium-binding protein n=1 Tax=Novosphingobium percolationis TaxID=2871811 RepID=UPI001CD7C263|nr:calcium-binding protein [Novosphingobium percolationis]
MAFSLGTQTHFGQGWSFSWFSGAEQAGTTAIRDGVAWGYVETAPGVYDFSDPKVAWVGQAIAKGAAVTLVFQPNNALYDSGGTVYTDAGRKAFADFVVATLKQFPGVTAIEIGNEYNSDSFVNGAVLAAGAGQRDDYYAKMLLAVQGAVNSAGLHVEVIGGAAHSIPVDYFADLKALGALDGLDAIAIHPYTTPAEQLEDQIGVLRSVVGNTIAIRATEFGQDFAALTDAPTYLAKMVSAMGAAGIQSADWYALARQSWFPNMELWDQSTKALTPAGVTFSVLQGMLAENGKVTHLATDDFSYLYAFGTHSAVLWGEARTVTLAAGVTAYDLAGNQITNFDGRISMDQPVILKSAGTITAASVTFAATDLVADSYHQFDVTNTEGGTTGFEGPWSYFSLNVGSGREEALYTMGGGMVAGEPWTPYLGSKWLRPLAVTATSIVPVDWGAADNSSKYDIVERFTVAKTGTYSLTGDWDVNDATNDGVLLTVKVNGNAVASQVIYDPANGNRFHLDLGGVSLTAGDKVDFVVDSRANPIGDNTDRHIQVRIEGYSFVATGGNDTFVGSAGLSDYVTFGKATAGVTVDLEKSGVNATGFGSDTLTGIENFTGSAYDDLLYGNALANAINGGGGNDKLYGRAGDDLLVARAGADLMDGGTGADRMFGGAGNDTYYVDNARDQVVEYLNEGSDIVYSSVSFTLGDNVENLTMIGTASVTGTGNALANAIKANDGANKLYGMAGDDNLNGGGGNDWLNGGLGKDTLTGGLGADRFVFAALADSTVSAPDRITDFSRAQGDKIDLSGIDAISGGLDNAFGIGSKFTGHAGELIVQKMSGYYLVSGDVNGDKSADFAFQVVSSTALGVGDFIL